MFWLGFKPILIYVATDSELISLNIINSCVYTHQFPISISLKATVSLYKHLSLESFLKAKSRTEFSSTLHSPTAYAGYCSKRKTGSEWVTHEK